MSSISVRQTTQKIVVDASTGAVSVISAGAQGPAGPPGTFPITFGDTPPIAPNIEDLWVNTDTFTLHGYYNDGDSVQWVEIGSLDVADLDLAALADALVPYILADPDFEEGSGGGGTTTPPTVTISTTTHTLDLANKATLTMYDNPDEVEVVVPAGVFEDGDWVSIQSTGAGGITFDYSAVTVIGDDIPDIPQYGGITIIFTAPDTITFFGGAAGGSTTAADVSIDDAGDFWTSENVEDLTQELAAAMAAFGPFVSSSIDSAIENIQVPFEITVACSDEDTVIDSTGTKVTFRMPFEANLTEVRASLTSACTTGTFTVDVNEEGGSVLSTKVTIDATETTSVSSATEMVVSDPFIMDDAEVTIDVDDIGDGTATGLKVTLKGTRPLIPPAPPI